jgi:hypothetical protein
VRRRPRLEAEDQQCGPQEEQGKDREHQTNVTGADQDAGNGRAGQREGARDDAGHDVRRRELIGPSSQLREERRLYGPG